MSEQADRTGTFRGDIIEYGLRREKSGSVGIGVKVALKEMWDESADPPGWIPWDYDQLAFGTIYVIKKDGHLHETGFRPLVEHANWYGDFDSINNATWKPLPVQFTLEANEYQGKTTYRVGFVNGWNDTPGNGLGKCDAATVNELKTKYGSTMRAFASTVRAASAPKPAGDEDGESERSGKRPSRSDTRRTRRTAGRRSAGSILTTRLPFPPDCSRRPGSQAGRRSISMTETTNVCHD